MLLSSLVVEEDGDDDGTLRVPTAVGEEWFPFVHDEPMLVLV